MKYLLSALLLMVAMTLSMGVTAQECDDGYVYREAYRGDTVCVTSEVRAQTARDNTDAANRYAAGSANVCKPEYVWRLAGRGDLACVHWTARDMARQENRLAPERRTAGSILIASDSARVCKPGFVWRMAFPTDYVCVPPEARARVHQENQQAGSNTGNLACKPGFVWREVLPNDYVCVRPAARNQAQMDNQEAQKGSRHRPTLCRAYAKQAVLQFNEMTALNCSVSGVRWQSSEENHYNWCVMKLRRNREHEAGGRTSELIQCKESKNYATVGAAEACTYKAVITNQACLNADGSASSLVAGGTTAEACARNEERAKLFARVAFAANACISNGDTPDPGCCTVTEEVSTN